MAPDLRALCAHALLAGLAVLVPVPLLDERILAAVKRRMVRDLAGRHQREVEEEALDVLAGLAERRPGLVRRSIQRVVAGVRKVLLLLFRKLTVVLVVRDAVNVASRTLHEGWLLDAALREGRGRVTEDHARRVRKTLNRTLARTRTRAFDRGLRTVFQEGFRRLRGAAVLVAGAFRSHLPGVDGDTLGDEAALPGEEEEQVLFGALVDRLAATASRERAHLEQVESRFRSRLVLA